MSYPNRGYHIQGRPRLCITAKFVGQCLRWVKTEVTAMRRNVSGHTRHVRNVQKRNNVSNACLGHFLIGHPCGSLVELWSKASEIFRDRRNVFFSVHKLVGSERLR